MLGSLLFIAVCRVTMVWKEKAIPSLRKSYYVKGSFCYLSTYDCGSFVVNGKAVIGKEYNLQSEL